MEQTEAPAAGIVVFHGEGDGQVIDVDSGDVLNVDEWR